MNYEINFGSPVSFGSLRPGLFVFSTDPGAPLLLKFEKHVHSQSGILRYTHAAIDNGDLSKISDENQKVFPVNFKQMRALATE